MKSRPFFIISLAFGFLTLSIARRKTEASQELEVLTNKSCDYVTKINSTDIPKLLPGEYLIQFLDPCPTNPYFDHENQIYFVYLPEKFKVVTNVTLGVLAFISHTNQWGMWSIYKDLFDTRNLIYFCPQNVGNMAEDQVRQGAAAAGIAYFQSVLPIDPGRVYASGLSGGGRISCQMAWDNGTWINGVIGICGCDYKRRVTLSSASDPSYGFYNSYPLPDDVLRETVRVVIITGSNDFLDTNLNDIYYNGLVEDNLTGWLIDIPGGGHEMPDYMTYDQALKYLDDNPPKCVFPCKQCSLVDKEECTSCYTSIGMSLLYDNSTSLGSCVEFCPDGYYAYDGYCLTSCPDGTDVSNDGYQDICTDESSEDTDESSEDTDESSEDTDE